MTWVSVWCREFSVDFGHVFLSPIEEQGCSSGSSESGLPGNADDIDRAAKSVGILELDSTIAKDLNDSEDPKHTLFCREIAFVAIYALFGDDISIF